jgi:hypothetical protein
MDKQILWERKAHILSTHLNELVNRADFLNRKHGDRFEKTLLEERFGVETINIASNINKAWYKRSKRVREHVEYLFSLDCELIFLTLTFDDAVLKSTSPETRRKYVARWLKKASPVYVANVDYGETKGREHYHALVCSRISDSLADEWRKHCGNVNFKKIRKDEKSKKAVPRYISKLTNHAIKETANKGSRIIYSKTKKIDFSEVF